MNVTVCLSQSTTANFTCVVTEGGTGVTTTGWQVLVGDFYINIGVRDRHLLDPRLAVMNIGTIVIETLTIINVSVNDNGAKYRCEPVRDVISDVVTLTVLGTYVLDCCRHTYICKLYVCLLVYAVYIHMFKILRYYIYHHELYHMTQHYMYVSNAQ